MGGQADTCYIITKWLQLRVHSYLKPYKMSNLTEQEQLQLIHGLEIEMMADMYNKMSGACQKKCIPPIYGDSELTKGESVCLDRCVAKYLDVHERIGKKLASSAIQDKVEEFL